ncbi:MAG: hypothetical protein NTZ50_04710 [Chloroflexi bacterium]|nr:hypothetical protein [Chloroflexota bacterium]
MFRRLLAAAAGCVLLLPGCASVGTLDAVSVVPTVISPNGDGKADIARFTYALHTPSAVSIYLVDTAGRRYDLRRSVARPASPKNFELLFNGMDADGKLVPNGEYTWHVVAGESSATGLLRVENADEAPPKISEFTTTTREFTPNRDAIEDHVYINVVIDRPAKLSVYVLGADGFRQDIPREELARMNANEDMLEAGRYFYNYDGGIDKGADPPPDGEYTLVAEAVDRIGQRDVVTRPLTIRDSGRPVAEIITQPNGQGIEWQGIGTTPEATFKLGDTIHFSMTVRNVGTTPIRTAGPFDGTDCYTLDENRYTKGFAEEPGVWRVGVDFETNTGEDHPFRWATGSLVDLDVVEHNGVKLYYLAPGKQVVVHGCVTFTRIPVRNPFRIWGSLIQEQVEISAVNSNVTPILITVVKP